MKQERNMSRFSAWVSKSVSLIAAVALSSTAFAQQPAVRGRAPQPGQYTPSAPLRVMRPPIVQDGGPSTHKVLSASSADGLNWTRDPGVRLEQASVPCALADGDRVVLYYVDGAIKPSTAGCAISTDGLTFTKQAITIEGRAGQFAADPCALKNTSGTYCLYYLAGGTDRKPGPPLPSVDDLHEIHLAVGNDPLHLKDIGTVLNHKGLVDPDVFYYKGTWFMYVFSDRNTIIATSSTGRDFKIIDKTGPPKYGTVAPVHLADGRLRLYAFEQNKPAGTRFVSFLSDDGLNWTLEPGTRLQAAEDEMITDPFVIPWQGGYKMYFKLESRARALGQQSVNR
jgi:hypothetical protein